MHLIDVVAPIHVPIIPFTLLLGRVVSFLIAFSVRIPSSTFGVPLVAPSSRVRSQCLLLKKASFSLAGSHRRDALCTLQLFLREVQLLFIAAPLYSLLLAGCHRSWLRSFHLDLLLGKNQPRLSP